MISEKYKALSIVLLLTGAAFVLLKAIMMLMPGPWSWEPRQGEYEMMIVGVYFVLGLFTINAARAPEKHLSLVWFVATSNLTHGLIMFMQALADPSERSNLWGDVPALIITGVLIVILAPKRLTEN